MMNLNNPVFNKILKIKEHLVLGAEAKKKLFEKLKEKLLKEGRKRIRLSQLEFDLLIESLNRAEEYEHTLNKIEDTLDDVILLSKSGHKESDEYNHFWRCSVWERNVISIQKSIKLRQSV